MISNKRAFLVGILLAPILSIGLLGGLGAAQSVPQTGLQDKTDNLSVFIDPPTNNDQNPVPAPTVHCQTKIMQVVAHQDDDLLFMNPDLRHSLDAGACVRTFYITAGDAGQAQAYWQGREQGAEAAYASMLGRPDNWQVSQTKLIGQYVLSSASLAQDPAITLYFVRLPDGNLDGSGFATTGYQSLQKLEAGQISTMTSVDGQASYTLNDLANMLAGQINDYQPDTIRTQADDYPDHSDHIAVGRLVSQAYQLFSSQQISIKTIGLNFYRGYSISSLPINLNSADITQKGETFMEYAKHDSAVCSSIDICNTQTVYGNYLNHQYQVVE